MDFEKAKIFAEKTAVRAGKALLEYANKIEIVKQKDRQDIATNADLASEKIVITAIEKYYPDHNIFSEEHGRVENNSSYTWIIDPLDGTKEYVRGIPDYNVALSLLHGKESLVSAVFRPADSQLFSAINNGGAFLNGKKITVSGQSDLADSFIYAYLPHSQKKDDEFNLAWQKLIRLSKRIYRLRSLADLNVSCCWLAMGGHEGFINLFNTPPPWDILPGLLIAREAGACATNLTGRPLVDNFKNGIIVSNGKIHDSLLEVLNES